MKKSIYFFSLFLFTILTSCSSPKDRLTVAASALPHAQILEFIKPDLKKQGIDLAIVIINDYNIPNRALADKEVDANFFQHLIFLDEQIKEFHYRIESIAKVELEPMGIYSKKYPSLADLPAQSIIAIPNDPTNEGRALLLLQAQGLIQLNSSSFTVTTVNISNNPNKFKLIEIDAAMLPRALPDVAAAVINTNYALEAGLSPQRALALESPDSPYANVLVVRSSDVDRPDLHALKAALTSGRVREFIEKHYKGAIIPAF